MTEFLHFSLFNMQFNKNVIFLNVTNIHIISFKVIFFKKIYIIGIVEKDI